MAPQAHVQPPSEPAALRRWMALTLVLLMLWFGGPQATLSAEEAGRRRRLDPRAHARSPGGWVTGLPVPARARRSARAAPARVAARRRPGRRA